MVEAIAGSPDSHAVACGLIAAFEEIAAQPRPMSKACAHVSDAIGEPVGGRDEAVQRACIAVARMIDDEHEFFERHAYHNRRHFCEVVLTAQLLCELNQVPARDARRILLAALVHDLEHDGSAACGSFIYERRSVVRMAPFLARAGVDQIDYQAIAALVLGTDARHGVPAVMAIRHWHGIPAPRETLQLPAHELKPLIDDRALCVAAAILCEADILPSVGLTLDHALHLQACLSSEWGQPLGQADKTRFIDNVVNHGLVSDFFMPNVVQVRSSLNEHDHALGR